MARSGRPGGSGSPSTSDLAGVAAVDAVDRPQQLAAAGADEAGDAEHLAGVQLEAGLLDVGEALQAAHLEQDVAAAGGPLGEQLLEARGPTMCVTSSSAVVVGREARGHRRPLAAAP